MVAGAAARVAAAAAVSAAAEDKKWCRGRVVGVRGATGDSDGSPREPRQPFPGTIQVSDSIDGIMTSVLASRAACVPVPHTEHPADTGSPGRIQHARIVVGEQAAARIEPEALARGLPEARVFLGMAEIV